jgi:hypothetical protein
MAAVAIGTTAVAVAGTAVSAGMQMSAADKAAKAQGAAGKKAAKADQAAFAARERAIKRLEKGQKPLIKDLKKIQAPEYNLPAMIADAEEASRSERAQAFGSEAQYEALRKQALANISQGLAGQLTDAELGAVRREQAFLQGAGFNPATAGRGAVQQVGPYSYLRAIGGEAGRKIGESFNLLGQWGDIAKSYIKGAEPFGALRYQYGMGAANIGMQKIDTRRQMLADLYGAQIGGAEAQQQMGQRQYARQLETAAANKAASDAISTGIGDVTGTVGQLGMAGYMAYNQLETAKAAELAGGALSNKTLYATPQMSQQYNYGTMAGITDRPVAIPQSRYI